MKLRNLIYKLTLVLALTTPARAAEPAVRPNIVFIISDDQAWSDYGFMGHPEISTPRLDNLASESITFQRGYTPVPVYRPSLATMITGLYPHQHGVTGNDPDLPDSAYPLQTAPGIETIYVAADQLEVVQGVIAELAKTKHVKPTIYTDAELKHVAETNAPGISAYRAGLGKLLQGQPVSVLPHEQIIGKLDEAGKTFKVLLIKTPLTKPYTSVFFQLECGYWNEASEKALREAMKAAK